MSKFFSRGEKREVKMITIQQVKAARALLDWNQSDLAKASGISVPAIARLEQGIGNPRADTAQAIQSAFEDSGIEFNEDLGVSLRRDVFKLEVFNGNAGMDRVWDDVVATLAARGGGEVLLGGVDERITVERYGDRIGAEIKRRRKLGITHRLLIREGDNFVLGSADVYRCLPEALFGQMHYYIYADKYVLINGGPPLKVILIHNKNVADTFRKQFNFHWGLGTRVKNPKVLYPITGE